MKLFENKVGRPSNEVIKKRRNFYLIIVFFIAFIFGFSALVIKNISDNSKLMGAANSKSVTIESITTSSFIVHWKATGSLKASSFAIYNSTSACKAGSKVESHLITNVKVKTYKTNGTWKISGLGSGKYYLVSVKYNDGKVLNKCVKTTPKVSTIKITYNLNSLSSYIGTQCNKCGHNYALAYGHYILTDGKTKLNSKVPKVDTSKFEDYYGAFQSKASNISSLWNVVKTKINSGIPVLVRAYDKNKNPISPYHCILIVGYKTTNPTSTTNFLNSVYYVDSMGTGLNKLGSGYLKEYNGLSDTNIKTGLYDLMYSTWNSKDKAKKSSATKK